MQILFKNVVVLIVCMRENYLLYERKNCLLSYIQCSLAKSQRAKISYFYLKDIQIIEYFTI